LPLDTKQWLTALSNTNSGNQKGAFGPLFLN
jgi:hypothetical protein